MSNDKRIAATLIDAIFIGNGEQGLKKNTEYRLRAVKTRADVIKVKIDKQVGAVLVYGSMAHFESSWINVRRVAETLW